MKVLDFLQVFVYVVTIAAPLIGVAVKIGQYTKTISDLTTTVKNIEGKLNRDFSRLEDHEKRITKLESGVNYHEN